MRRPPRILTDDQADRLLAGISRRSDTGVRNRALWQVMLGAGLRPGEALRLRPPDLDWDAALITVTGDDGRVRQAPMDAETYASLREWAARRARLGLGPETPVFVGVRTEGRPLTLRAVQQMLAGRARAAGIHDGATPMTLRHTWIVRLLRRGLTRKAVSELAGLRNPADLRIYDPLLNPIAPHPGLRMDLRPELAHLLADATDLELRDLRRAVDEAICLREARHRARSERPSGQGGGWGSARMIV